MDQGYINQGWYVTEVTFYNLTAIQTIDMVHGLKADGLVLDVDFEFAYHRGEWDNGTGEKSSTFRFADPNMATWFTLKYSK